MSGINTGVLLKGFSDVKLQLSVIEKQIEVVQQSLQVTSAISVLNLGVSVMGFAVINQRLNELEKRLVKTEELLNKIDKKIDLRGDKLSGHQFVKSSALKYLVILLEKYLPSPPRRVVDNLDPLRRFEMAFPSLGQELNDILQKETSLAAREMLQLAQTELERHLQNYPALAVEVVLNQLSSNNPSVG